MADYYPILSRAVSALEGANNTADARRGVYDRARSALLAQLRGFDPPLSEADIKSERLALEEGIRRIEAEFRQNEAAAAAPPPSPMAAPEPPVAPPPLLRNPPPPQPYAEDDDEAADAAAASGLRAQRDPDQGQWQEKPRKGARKAGKAARETRPKSGRGGMLPIIAGAVIVLLLLIGGGAYFMRDQLGFSSGGETASAPSAVNAPGKNADRISQGSDGSAPNVAATPAQPAAPAPAAPAAPPPAQVQSGAEKAILYEENGDPQGGATFEGTVTWRVESVSPGQGQPPETVLRGDINIPERMSAVLLFKRNTDSTLPASHTIEIQFNLPPNFPNAGITNVPGLIMKADEQSQGAALAGLSVRVTGGVFLIGLSNIESERGTNEQLLRDRGWIDVPILYDNGRRAVLTLERGTPGNEAFAEALSIWGSVPAAGSSPMPGGTTTPQ